MTELPQQGSDAADLKGNGPRRLWTRRVRVICAVALVAFLLAMIGPRAIFDAFLVADLQLLGLAVLLTPVVIAVKILRWFILVRTRMSVSLGDAAVSYLAGLAVGTATPASAGELTRGLFLPSQDRMTITGLVLVDKIIDLLSLCLFAGASLCLFGERAGQTTGAVILIGGMVAAAMLLAGPQIANKCGSLATLPFFQTNRIQRLLEGLTGAPRRWLVLNIVIAAGGVVVLFGQQFIVLRALCPTAPIELLPFLPVVALSRLVPITVGGIGVRELAAVIVFREFGVPEAAAFSASLTHFMVVQMVPSLIGAGLIAVAGGRRSRQNASTDASER